MTISELERLKNQRYDRTTKEQTHILPAAPAAAPAPTKEVEHRFGSGKSDEGQ